GDQGGLGGEAEPVEDFEDPLDLAQGDRLERHDVTPSCTEGVGRRSARTHSRNASARIRPTSAMKKIVIPASSRRLNICVRTSPTFSTATVPAARPAASLLAPARKPSAGSGENTFCHPAVMVTASSHERGSTVVHA